MILFNFGVYFISFVLYTVHKFNIMMYHSSNCHLHEHFAIVASAGFFVLLAKFTSWIKFVSQMEVVIRNYWRDIKVEMAAGLRWIVNTKSNRKELNDGLEEMLDY